MTESQLAGTELEPTIYLVITDDGIDWTASEEVALHAHCNGDAQIARFEHNPPEQLPSERIERDQYHTLDQLDGLDEGKQTPSTETHDNDR